MKLGVMMATLEEMHALREYLAGYDFPPDSLGLIAVCDHTGKIMFTAVAGGKEHDNIDPEHAHKLFNQMAVAVSARVADLFTHSGDIGALENELKGNTLQ